MYVTSLIHGRLPEYPIAQRFLEISFEISACANSVYQAFLLPLLERLGMRLQPTIPKVHMWGSKYRYIIWTGGPNTV